MQATWLVVEEFITQLLTENPLASHLWKLVLFDPERCKLRFIYHAYLAHPHRSTISQTPLLTYQPIHTSLPRSTPIEAHPVQPKHISNPPPHTSTYPHQPTPINTYRSPSSLTTSYLRPPSLHINLSTPAYPDQHLSRPIQPNNSLSQTPIFTHLHLPTHSSQRQSKTV